MKHITRVLVFGSRTLKDYNLVEKTLLKLFPPADYPRIEIVEGGQVSDLTSEFKYGADYFASVFASKHKHVVAHTQYPANWDLYGKKAGPLRNEVMGEYCAFQHGVGFWDGTSRGTANMINICDEKSISLTVVKFKP